TRGSSRRCGRACRNRSRCTRARACSEAEARTEAGTSRCRGYGAAGGGPRQAGVLRRAAWLKEGPDRSARLLRRHAAEISIAARQLPADGAEGRSGLEGHLVSLAHWTDRRQGNGLQAV